MPLKIRGRSDKNLKSIIQELGKYESEHPHANIEAYRQNSVSIRVRIIDPDFAGIEKADRHNTVWQILEKLPENVQSQISVLLLLTPAERKKSFASAEFDDPIRSKL